MWIAIKEKNHGQITVSRQTFDLSFSPIRPMNQHVPTLPPDTMKTRGIPTICLLALPCILLSGCLSLQFGGKTHNCNGSVELSEANARIAYLESRISALEHYAGIAPLRQSSVSVVSHQTEHGGGR